MIVVAFYSIVVYGLILGIRRSRIKPLSKTARRRDPREMFEQKIRRMERRRAKD